jgi:thermitase
MYESVTPYQLATTQGLPDSVLVKFRPNATPLLRAAALQESFVSRSEPLKLADAHAVHLHPGQLQRALASYRSRSDVEHVHPNYPVQATFVPNDPQWSSQDQLFTLGVPAAWDISQSSSSTLVSVLDCGVFSEVIPRNAPDGLPGHPDLRGRIAKQVNLTTSLTFDDVCDHGTRTLGIVGAATNNAVGIAGIAFNARLESIKVLDDNGDGMTQWVIDGIVQAANDGAKVISLSLNNRNPDVVCSGVPLMQSAMDYAWISGAVVIVSAGNGGPDEVGDNRSEFPADCNHVLSVGATDQFRNRASFSNYGQSVHVTAPGVSIQSTDRTGGYSPMNGTSFSAPAVAGIAALIWSTPHGSSNQAVVNRILETARPIDGTGTYWRYGLASAFKAVGPVAPANDRFVNATSLTTLPSNVTQTTVGAMDELNEPNPCGAIGSTVWFRVVPTWTGTMTVSTASSTFDTVLAAHMGSSLGNLSVMSCNDQAIPGAHTSALSLSVISGTTYYVQVGGFGGETGALTLSVSGPPGPTLNSLSVSTSAGGVVTSNPSGINCGSDCLEAYPSGSVVTLSATPSPGFSFNGWGGSCSGIGTCSVSMTTPRSVSASFSQASGPDLSISVTDARDPVTVGGQLTYTVTISSTSATTSSPLVSVGLSGWDRDGITHTCPGPNSIAAAIPDLQCNIGQFAAAGTKSFTVSFAPAAIGQMTNVVTVSSSQNDPNPGNNSAPVSTTVVDRGTACNPRPNVRLAVSRAGVGHVQVVVDAGYDAIQSIRFQRGTIDIVGGPAGVGGGFTHRPPAGTGRLIFSFRNVPPAEGLISGLLIRDGCGDWTTFVGMGTGPFSTP